ncbi:unnamed protein product [Rhodiola kirilowii]
MAISTPSSDWSLTSFSSRQNHHHHHTPFHLPCSNFHRQIASSSSASPSPETLQETSSLISTTLTSLAFQTPPDSSTNHEINQQISDLLNHEESFDLGLKLYHKAKLSVEFRPEKFTLNQVMRSIVKYQKWGFVSHIVADFSKFDLFPDGSVCGSVISGCIKARKFRILDTFLDAFQPGNVMSIMAFDVAMRGYNSLHMYSSTVKVFQKMKSRKITLDTGIYCHIMEAYMRTGDYEKVLELFHEFEAMGLLSKSKATNPSKIYAVLYESLGRSGRAFEALEIFRRTGETGDQDDPGIYASLVSSFAIVHEVGVAEELFYEAVEKKMMRDPAIFLKMVLMYIENGLLEKTVEVVRAMKEAKIGVSDCIFCAIVNGYSKRIGLQAAIRVYYELILEGCKPGQVTYASMINVYIRIGLYAKAEELFKEMELKGYDKCVVAYSSMIAMYGKTGRLKDAMRLLAKMKERGCKPNVWIYNALMDMHGRVKNLRQVEKIWSEMKRRKVAADKVSYTSIISAYCKAKEFDTCVNYYNEFRINGGGLDRALAGTMIGIYSKLDMIDQLVKLLQDMKSEGIELDDRLYWSAFNALRDAGLEVQANCLQDSFQQAESKILRTSTRT